MYFDTSLFKYTVDDPRHVIYKNAKYRITSYLDVYNIWHIYMVIMY